MKKFCALWRKSFKEIPQLFAAPISVNQRRQNAIYSTPISRKSIISKIFQPIFRVTRISHSRKFDMTSVPVRIVDTESLSEITIHNFE